jgi:hypothetical protein
MELTFAGSSERLSIAIDGAALIDQAEELAARLEEVLAMKAPLVSLDLTAISDADASFFQLMLAFRASLAGQGRSVELAPLPYGHVVPRKAELVGIDLSGFFGYSGGDDGLRG